MKPITWEEAFDFLSKFKICYDNGYVAAIQICGGGIGPAWVPAYITLYKLGTGMLSLTICEEDNQIVHMTDEGSLILNSASCGHKYRSVVTPLKEAPYKDYSTKSWSATETS